MAVRCLGRVPGYDDRTNRLGRDPNLLKWMVGAVIAVQLGILWMQWQALDRLSDIEAHLSAIEARIGVLQRNF
jgi:hypothetical protein